MIPLYFLLLFAFGIYKSNNQNKSDYLYLSRSLTLPAFVTTIVATWYGGILEIGRFSYNHGIVTWVIFGIYYYISALIYAFVIGPKLYKNNVNNIPKYFYNHYGKLPSKICSIIILLICSPAPYIMIFSTIFSHIYGLDLNTSTIIGILTSMIYISIGGFKSIINTDKLQFIFMYIGFIIIFLFLYTNFGGYEFIKENVPSTHLELNGNLSLGFILSWSLISMITFIDPNLFQRIYSAKNKSIIKKGFIVSMFFWLFFDFLTISIGLYSRAIMDTNIITGNPYLDLSDKILPPIYKNIFYIALLSVVMSTIDSFTYVSANTIKNDFLNKDINYKYSIWIGVIITALTSYIIVMNFNYVIDIWYISGTIAASVILIPFLNCLFFEYKIKYPVLLLIFPLIITIYWIILDNPYNIDALYPGILSSLLFFYFFKVRS